MKQQNKATTETSRVTWENIETWVRTACPRVHPAAWRRRGGGWLSQWAWEPTAVDAQMWDDHGPAAPRMRE